MRWKFNTIEWERINMQRLSQASAYSVRRKVAHTGLFPFVKVTQHDDGEGWCVAVTDPDTKTLKGIYNMYHFKTLCTHNGIDLKKLLAGPNKEPPTEMEARGFKTIGRTRRRSLTKRKLEDLL